MSLNECLALLFAIQDDAFVSNLLGRIAHTTDLLPSCRAYFSAPAVRLRFLVAIRHVSIFLTLSGRKIPLASKNSNELIEMPRISFILVIIQYSRAIFICVSSSLLFYI
jgi:hypothetical protein